MLLQAAYAIFYGDLLMMALYRTRPYEVEEGSANRLFDHWMTTCKAQLRSGLKRGEFKKTVRRIVEDFDTLPLAGEGLKPRVGVVGEILVKFHPTANNQIVDVIEREGCEAVVPGLAEFFLFGIAAASSRRTRSVVRRRARWFPHRAVGHREDARARHEGAAGLQPLRAACRHIRAGRVRQRDPVLVQLDGRGLAADRRDGGAHQNRCAERGMHAAFACLPNHVVGKAVIKELRRRYPESNIVAVDYDPARPR